MEIQENSIPMWFNKALLKNIFEKKLNQTLEIFSFTLESATKNGDNYTTNIFRSKVSTSAGDFDVIVKKSFDLEESITKPYNLFPKEIRFYSDYLPEMNEILKSIDEYEELAPELFYSNEEIELIVLSDLSIDGYNIVDRQDRVSAEGVEIVLRKLAKLHASSIICNRRRNGELEKEEYDLFRIEGAFKPVFVNHMQAFVAAVKSWGSEFDALIPKLEYIAENYLELADKTVTSKGPLNVLAHNDLWFNNILFKKDPVDCGKLSDAIFVDFQMIGWGSPAIDILHFFHTSLNEGDYQENYRNLIGIYHSHLERVLKKLEHDKVPTVEEILDEVKKHQFHGKIKGISIFISISKLIYILL